MRYLILGATGTLGRATIEALLKDEKTELIRCVSRDELKLSELKNDYPDARVQTAIGDIKDKASIRPHFDLWGDYNYFDAVFHFAALKRIPEMEAQPIESLKTNILGTINAAECAIEAKVSHFVFSSTDKACRPINAYGASKFLAEKILLSYRTKTQFSVYRWGNVIGSRGSAIKLFADQISGGGAVTITHPDMTRFWIRIEDAVKYILETYKNFGPDVRIPSMKSLPVMDMASVIAERLDFPGLSYKICGIRPGEKLHEDIVCTETTVKNSFNSEKYTREEALKLLDGVI